MICRRLDSIPTNPVQGDNLEDGSGTVGNHLSSGLPHLVCSLGLCLYCENKTGQNRGDLGLEEQTCNTTKKTRNVAQLGSAPALGAGGRGFESRHSDDTDAETTVLRVTTRG